EPDQTIDTVPGREAARDLFPVLVNPADQVIGNADIERPVFPAGEDIDERGHPLPQGSFRGGPRARARNPGTPTCGTDHRHFPSLCAWIPGCLATLGPRNDHLKSG